MARAIVFYLKQSESGVSVAEVCRKMGISEATFYNWKKSMVAWGLRSCDDYISWIRAAGAEENRRLKQLVADLSLEK